MNTKEALQEIKKGLIVFRAFEKADELIDLVQSAEGKAEELEKKNAKAEKELALLESSLKEANDAIAFAKAEADNIVDKAGKKALAITSEADKYADDRIAKAEKSYDEIKSACSAKDDELAKINNLITAANLELETITEALEKAKSKLRGFIG